MVVDELGENHGLGWKVHPQGKGVGAAHHVQDPLPEGPFHQQLFLGKHSSVVNADPVEKGRLDLRHLENGRDLLEPVPLPCGNSLPVL